MSKITDYSRLVKFSHTIFALPFALIGYAMGVTVAGFNIWVLAGVLLCMFFARSAAMGFNRWADRRIDARNPRTASREIPAGKISARSALWFTVICCLLFVATAATFNTLTLMLSPVALIVILGYSYTKRFTSLCHFVLGLGLAIAPSAAYIAVTGSVSWPLTALSAMVFTWVAGFDIIYSLSDMDIDRGEGLHSIPARFGIRGALIISALTHILTICLTVVFGLIIGGNYLYWTGAAIFTGLLVYQHLIVKANDLSRINMAFSTLNGVASIIYAFFVILSIVLR